MERNREARRSSMAAMNGGSLSRRRQRNGGGLRDSPEEDGALEMPETSSRLRERVNKRDRERDRSNRSKRRRAERLMHGSSGREMDGDGSSDDSIDDDDDDEEDDHHSFSHRPPSSAPPLPSMMTPPPSSSSPLQQSSHVRRSIPPHRPVRPPTVWKVSDEMIGVQVPRKARSASGKRSQESWVSSGGGGSGEHVHRQPSTSPARPSTVSTAHNSPSSSSASVKKKLKPVGSSLQQQQQLPPKASPKPIPQDKIEIDVAEVLFKMARQFECLTPTKQEHNKLDSNVPINESKSRAPSPMSNHPPASQSSGGVLSNHGTTAPKRKRPRVTKYDEDNSSNLPSSAPLCSGTSSSMTKSEPEQIVNAEASSPKLDKAAASPAVEASRFQTDAVVSQPAASIADFSVAKQEDNQKPNSSGNRTEVAELTSSEVQRRPDLDVKLEEQPRVEGELQCDKPQGERFKIDLMAPPGKSSPDREDYANDHKASEPQIESVQKIGESRRDGVKTEPKRQVEEMLPEPRKEIRATEDLDLNRHKIRTPDLQLDLEKPSKDLVGNMKEQSQKQSKSSAKTEAKMEKPVSPSVSMPFPMPVSGWPGNLTPFGYMGQVPSLSAVLPVDGSSGSSKALVPPPRPKCCATHCYIAKTIHYHQQITKVNAYWPAAAGAMHLYGAKPYNLNAVPPSDPAVHGNALQGSLPGINLSSTQDKGGGSGGTGYVGHTGGDKNSVSSNSVVEVQRKQLMLEQIPQPGSGNTMLGPAFIFPLNQHTAGAATATRPSVPKNTAGAGNSAPSSSTTINSSISSSVTGGSAVPVNFNFASLPPNDAQYLAILQNNGYPFPIPAHVSPYRGASPAVVPFISGSFYSSPMIHPSQLQQQPAGQQPSHVQQGHQNTSTSSGSSSSQKHQQNPQRVPPGGGGPSTTGSSSHPFPMSKQLHHATDINQDNPLMNDSRISQAQKSVYGSGIPMQIHPQNYALIAAPPNAPALGGLAGNQSEKQITQGFAMSYASLPGPAAATASPPGLDFSAITQNHPLFLGLPEATKHGFQMSMVAAAAAAAAAAAQAVQQKKSHQEDGKCVDESLNVSISGEEERKCMAANKSTASGLQHSLTFSRTDGEAPVSSVISNNVIDGSSRTLNLIHGASTGGRVPSRNTTAVPTTSATNTTIVNSSTVQQQQHLMQLQKQHQQIQLQHQLSSRPKSSNASNNSSVYSERHPTGSTVTKFPPALPGFPQALIQGGGSPSQSPHWKTSSRPAGATLPTSSPASSSSKSQVSQQPNRVSHQTPPNPTHQTQISFGVNTLKMAVGSIGQSTMPSVSSAASVVAGSLPNIASKSTSIGSPQASPNVKSSSPVSSSLALPQASDKNSSSNTNLKPSSVSNRNMPSILGQPHISATPSSSSNSSAKQQQQQHSQPQQKQPFPQPQLFFSGAYMPSSTSQANATAIAYYQRHQSELPSQQHNSNPTSMGVLSLCSGAPHSSDPARTMAAAAAVSSLKGLPAPGLFQHPGQQNSGAPYPLMTAAAAAGFPYISSMQSVSVKPPEQKPAAGNDSQSASWQLEK